MAVWTAEMKPERRQKWKKWAKRERLDEDKHFSQTGASPDGRVLRDEGDSRRQSRGQTGKRLR